MPVRSSAHQGLDTNPVPHGHPKNDAAPCGKHLRDTCGTQDGQERRTKKNLDLSILGAFNNPKRTFASGGKLLKKFDQNFY